jgi:general secretion pathway protein D
VSSDNLTEESVIIIPVVETNSVVIIATPVEFKKYRDIIQRIDVPRQQVFVEVIIGEVSLDRSTQLGIEFWINRYIRNTQFGTKGGLGVYKGQDEAGNILAPLGSNLFAGGVLEKGQYELLMNALVQNSQINIISTPNFTVVENEQAEISVGSDVPVIASETAISTGQVGNLYPIRSVQYINTGIILKVKAAILTDNKISLEISQEVSEALENKTSDISSPEILKRTIKTTLIVNEGEIAFIGGLFQKKLSTGGSGIPVLSRIPLLGSLFKNEKKQIKKTELVVFINSKTIRKNNDMKEIVEAVKKLYSVNEDVISTSEKKK